MSFTRFYDDPARIQKGLEQSTYAGMYRLNTPGPGLDLPYMHEPQMRLSEWGANFSTNSVTIESDLRGMTRKLNKDLVDVNNYALYQQLPPTPTYREDYPFIEESRASHPAWLYKDKDHTRWETPMLNPVENVIIPFPYDIQTRIIEKNIYKPVVPTPLQQ
jgi:hypothetical protein